MNPLLIFILGIGTCGLFFVAVFIWFAFGFEEQANIRADQKRKRDEADPTKWEKYRGRKLFSDTKWEPGVPK